MVLVPEETFKQHQPPRPLPSQQPRSTSVLDYEMTKVMSDVALADDVKWKLYQQILHKFAGNRPMTTMPQPKQNEISMDFFQSRIRQRAWMFINALKRTRRITWDEEGQVSIDGIPLMGSNIYDLVQLMVSWLPLIGVMGELVP